MRRLGVPTIPIERQCKAETKQFEPPKYPSVAARANIQGWVVLHFDLDGSGHATSIVVERSSPIGIFDQVAIDALRGAQFVEGAKRTACETLVGFTIR